MYFYPIREDYASVPQGHLTYIAPEILRTIRVQPPYIIEEEPHTMESDVYAFGWVGLNNTDVF